MGLVVLLDNTDKHILMYDNQLQMHQNNPPKSSKYNKIKVNPFIFSSYHRVPNLSQFCCKASWFRVNSNFEISALNGPKWPCTLKGQRYPIHILPLPTTPKFHPSLLHGYTLGLDVFKLHTPFWDKCTKWPQIILNNKICKGTPHTGYNYPQLPNFSVFRTMTSRFADTDHFDTSALNDPKMTLNTKRSKVIHIHIIPTIIPNLLYGLPFASQPIFRWIHRMTPKWPWTLKG